MKRFIPLACAGLLAAAMASPSQAADIVRPAFKAPVYVAPFSWSGFYVGINGGAQLSCRMSSAPRASTIPEASWGIEGDIDATWLKGTSGAVPLCLLGCELKQTWLATVRGRVGYAFDRWLPYFTGGLESPSPIVPEFSALLASAEARPTHAPAGRSVAASNGCSWALGPPRSNTFMPILAPRHAPPRPASWRQTWA
jgi:hypothetical protein